MTTPEQIREPVERAKARKVLPTFSPSPHISSGKEHQPSLTTPAADTIYLDSYGRADAQAAPDFHLHRRAVGRGQALPKPGGNSPALRFPQPARRGGPRRRADSQGVFDARAGQGPLPAAGGAAEPISQA